MIMVKKRIQYFQNQTILDRNVTVWAGSPSVPPIQISIVKGYATATSNVHRATHLDLHRAALQVCSIFSVKSQLLID